MFLRLTLLIVLLFSCVGVMADEKLECGSAVDAADRLSPAADEHCDYTQTGLNGVLHRALAKSSDAGATNIKEGADSNTVLDKPKQNSVHEFSSPQQLQTLKFALLEKVALECPKGFVVEGERYLPTSSKATKLELIYHCL